ncbi:MAG: hypothetical protein AUK44_03600 [Porphyromonadaceae bacterium CG2_30_38_12]|nr:MAG: hypothetical protein AUK44_03600 [Porphyromonadaceae bacterium CG2_30_38_12]
MWSEKFTYLALMLGSLFFPLLLSFDKNVRFVQYFKPLAVAIVIPGMFFIVWDVLFTHLGYWQFNEAYTLGWRIFKLPLEEWMFFIVIPFCSIFIYKVFQFYFPNLQFNKQLRIFYFSVALLFSLIAIFNFEKYYSFITLLGVAFMLFFVLLEKSFLPHLTYFSIAFVVSCLPMLLVNGVLTAMPVVSYNSNYFSNIRLYSIPIEDFSYFFLLLLMNVFVFEKATLLFLRRK